MVSDVSLFLMSPVAFADSVEECFSGFPLVVGGLPSVIVVAFSIFSVVVLVVAGVPLRMVLYLKRIIKIQLIVQ